MKHWRHKQKGFSLIELVIVVAISLVLLFTPVCFTPAAEENMFLFCPPWPA